MRIVREHGDAFVCRGWRCNDREVRRAHPQPLRATHLARRLRVTFLASLTEVATPTDARCPTSTCTRGASRPRRRRMPAPRSTASYGCGLSHHTLPLMLTSPCDEDAAERFAPFSEVSTSGYG